MKKKGFTLVELLATLVILSVIALITVPVILNVIESSRKKAAIESFKGYMQASEEVVAEDDMEDESSLTQPDEEGCYSLVELDKLVSIKGVHPTISGEKKICFHKGTLTFLHSVIINGYEIWYDGEIHINKEGDENPDDPPSYMPTDEEPRTQVTTKSIKVINQQTVKIGEITEVEYAIKKSSDSTWGEWKTDDTSENYYLFDNLDSNTYYDVKTRVKTARKKEYVESKVLKVKTNSIPLPTFEEEGDTTTKTVTITFGSGLTNRYKKETDKTWTTVTGNTVDVPFIDNGTVIAESTDGKNTVNSSHTVTGIVKGTGIPSGSYQPGTTIKYAGLDWLVIKDNGNTTTLILKNNYTTGVFGTSASFASGNNAYTQVNTNFVNAHDVVKKDIENEMIILDSSTNSYVRLPKKDELSDKIPNGSNTNFWTLTSNGNNLYYGLPTGINTRTNLNGTSSTYYRGYGTSTSDLTPKNITTATTASSTTAIASPGSTQALVSATTQTPTNVGTWGDRIKSYTESHGVSYNAGQSISVNISGSTYMTCNLEGSSGCIYSCFGTVSYSPSSSYQSGYSFNKTYCSDSGSSPFTGSVSGYSINLPSGSVSVSSGFSDRPLSATTPYGTDSSKCPTRQNPIYMSYSGGTYTVPSYYSAGASSTYHFANPDDCSARTHYAVIQNKKDMGIRPVITIKEK